MFYDKLLEFPKILNILSHYASLDETKMNIMDLTPSSNKDEVIFALKETDEARESTVKLGKLDIFPFDIHDTLNRLRMSAPLNVHEFLEILKFVDDIARVMTYEKKIQNAKIDYANLKRTFESIVSLKRIKDLIVKVIDFDGKVLDSASSQLYQIRRRITLEESNLSRKINQLLEQEASKLSDTIVTIRNGRQVLPVKAEYKSYIKGIVQGESSSGQTIYIEPFATIEIENRIESFKEEEKREVERILYVLSCDVSTDYEIIKADYDNLLHLDLTFAKAYYAIDTDSVLPTISKNINLIKARHPLIDKEKIVPNNIVLNEGKIMIITGPNTGGKTVVLKTMGLIACMAQSGILIPCDLGSSLPVFSGIYADIGDEQSIEQSLSTFSSHMVRIVDILKDFENDSLVLLDELGSGTDPKEGASLAISIISYLKEFKINAFVTTHYPELKNFAYENEGTVNASVEFDIDSLRPTYRLLIGISGKSNAFLISERLGLNKKIIDYASEVSMGLNDASSLLMERLEKEADETRREREKYEKLNQDLLLEIERNKEEHKKEKAALKKQMDDINTKRNTILEKAQREAERLIDEIDKLKDKINSGDNVKANEIIDAKGRVTSFYQDKLMGQVRNDHEIKKGDNVRVLEFNQVGVVLDIRKDKYIVQIGAMKSSFSKEELEYEEEIKEKKNPVKKDNPDFIPKGVKTRLDLRGMRYEDAVQELDNFIDRASLENIDHIEVIHGYGTLALRNMVLKFAKTHDIVKSYRPGNEDEGGHGVTVLYLK